MATRARWFVTIVLGAGLLLAASTAMSAEPQPNYLAFKAGIFEPGGAFEDFQAAFSGEMALGRRFHRNAAGELAIGYLRAGTEDLRFDAFPLTVAAKALLPLGNVEPYATAGGGLYFARFAGEDDTTFGGFAGAGLQYKIEGLTGRDGFVGLEAKHLWLEPRFRGTDLAARGFQIMAMFGVAL